MRVSKLTLEQAMREVAFWQRGSCGGFLTSLFNTYQRADPSNKEDLFDAFPILFTAYESWFESKDPEGWIRKQFERVDA